MPPMPPMPPDSVDDRNHSISQPQIKFPTALTHPLQTCLFWLRAHTACRVTACCPRRADDAATGFRICRDCAIGFASDWLLQAEIENFANRVFRADDIGAPVVRRLIEGSGGWRARGRCCGCADGDDGHDKGAGENHLVWLFCV